MYQDKVRTMMRSILPSKARISSKKNKTDSHRSYRHRVKAALNNYDWEEEDDSDLTLDIHEATREYHREIDNNKDRRRDADKVNHFVRWAQEITKELPDIRSKYFSFVTLIGGRGDVIRDHAVGHFINPRYDFRYAEMYGEDFVFRRRGREENRRPISKAVLYPKLLKAWNAELETKINEILWKCGPLHCHKGRCWEVSYDWQVISEWELLDNGSRKRVYQSQPLTSHSAIRFKNLIQYNTCYKRRSHNPYKCSRMIQVDGVKSLQRVMEILYRWPKRFVIESLGKLVADL